MFKNFISETAGVLIDFFETHDPYGYMDAEIEDERVHLMASLENGEDGPIRERLSLFAEESDDPDLIGDVCELMRRLDLIPILQKKLPAEGGTFDYEQMKKTLILDIVPVEPNQEMLNNMPHRLIEDMAVVYRFLLDSDNRSCASLSITNDFLEGLGVTREQLHADAVKYAPLNYPAEVKGMSEVLAEIMGFDPSEFLPSLEDDKMFVASTCNKLRGAGVIAYPGFMEQASAKLGGSFYLLPSSIHEVLLVPDNSDNLQCDNPCLTLKDMVCDVNATQVAPTDRLTDNVYHYDADSKIFEAGEKYIARLRLQEKKGGLRCA